MDNHPIPQDVTGFQFRLIGNMTVKQFAYLAGGCVLAWFFYVLPLFTLLKFSFITLSVAFGVSLAFIPIEGRSLDIMLTNYLKALFNPNIFIYQKIGGSIGLHLPPVKKKKKQKIVPADEEQREKIKAYIHSMPKIKQNKLDERENNLLKSLSLVFSPGGNHSGSDAYNNLTPHVLTNQQVNQQEKPKSPPFPIIKEGKDEEIKQILENEAVELKNELQEIQQEEKTQTGPSALEAHQKVLELEQQLNDVLAQKQQLEQQVFGLQQKLSTSGQKGFTSPLDNASKQTQNVRQIPKDMERKVGVPIVPDIPNLVTGVIKDARGNVLPNILIEVKDAEGNPVRAFKTNKLGQFASATPLSNGAYTIEFDDPQGKNKFDVISVATTGEPFPPLEVISTDEREELRKLLFAN